MSYGPLFEKYKLNVDDLDKLTKNEVNSLSIDYETSKNNPPTSPKTTAATLFNNDLEIAKYMNLGKIDHTPLGRQTLVLKQDHIVSNETAEDNILDKIKHRYKKEILKTRPHSEADMGKLFILKFFLFVNN